MEIFCFEYFFNMLLFMCLFEIQYVRYNSIQVTGVLVIGYPVRKCVNRNTKTFVKLF